MEYTDPISHIKWLDVRELNPNDYNPNVVLNQELNLLKFSLLKTGWIQPILVSDKGVIIDGYHRYWLSSNDKDLISRYGYKAPCAVLNIDEAERMLLTIRINRAKGNHVAVKMHELVSKVFHEHGYSIEDIGKSIGASKDEINLLLKEDVFDALDIKNHKYSKAWIPKTNKN